MNQLILILHISGALLLGITGLIALYVLFSDTRSRIPFVFYTITLLSIIEIFTGTLLGVIGNQSVVAFCSKIGIYLFAVMIVQISLLFQNRSRVLLRTFISSNSFNFASILTFILIS